MSVTAPASGVDITDAELEEFVELVMMLLRDKSENNILLNRIQFPPADVKRAIRMATGHYNMMSPQTAVTWRALPETLLFHGTAYYLMLSESFLQARNQVSVNTDGLGVVGIDDKAGLYQQIGAGLKATFEEYARNIKTEQNMLAAFGRVSSGYLHVSRFHNS